MKPESLTVPEGEENVIAAANRATKTVKQKISLLVNDGTTFPAWTEIQRLLALPDPGRVYQDLARATAKAKMAELTDLVTQLESSCAHLAALILSLGEDLNNQETLDAVVLDITTSCEVYAQKARTALCTVAAATGGPPWPQPQHPEWSQISSPRLAPQMSLPNYPVISLQLISVYGC